MTLARAGPAGARGGQAHSLSEGLPLVGAEQPVPQTVSPATLSHNPTRRPNSWAQPCLCFLLAVWLSNLQKEDVIVTTSQILLRVQWLHVH